jgi:hypothetical protein
MELSSDLLRLCMEGAVSAAQIHFSPPYTVGLSSSNTLIYPYILLQLASVLHEKIIEGDFNIKVCLEMTPLVTEMFPAILSEKGRRPYPTACIPPTEKHTAQ